MPTYYKYVERNADSQVNWAEVGKNMSDMLIDQNRIRQEKKDAIDSATRKLGQEIADSPQGEHKEARTAALEFADDAAQYMRLQDKLLKSGELNFKDYSINRQNLSDGVGRAYGALKSYQEVAGKKMARWRNKESSLYELRKMEQGEKWGNWSKSNFYVNPTNGTVNVGLKTKKVIDGKEVYTMDSTPGEFASIGYVEGIINGYWDKLDVNKVADEFVKGLGKETRSVQNKIAELSKTGEITTISDITSRKDIDPETQQVLFQHINLENQTVDASLANPFDEGSILTDNGLINKKTGKPYDITPDETMAKNNPNLIYEKIDPSTGMGTLVFTKDQHKEAQNYVRNVIRGKYNYQEDVKVTPQLDIKEYRPTTEAEYKNKALTEDADAIAETVNNVLTGSPAIAKAAIDEINTTPGVNARKEGNKIIVDRTNPETGDLIGTETITLDKSGSISASGMSLAKILNPEMNAGKVLSSLKKKGQGKVLNLNSSALSGKVAPAAAVIETPITIYSQHIDKTLTPAVIPEKATEVEVKNALNEKLNDIGITVSSSLLRGNSIYLKNNDGKESPVFNLGNKKEAMENMKKWIKSNPSKNLKDLIQSGVVPSGTGKSATTGTGTATTTGGVIR
jgi:hypothetical protein